MDNDEKKQDKNKHRIIQPDPLAAAKSDPGKAINHRHGITTIKNVDILNSVYIAYLDLIKDRARERVLKK